MTAMINMKFSISDAMAACATVASLFAILYVFHVIMKLF